MNDIYEKIVELKKIRMPAALVTVIDARGSTPRGTGAKMLVYGNGKQFGTIGGSAVEAKVISTARACIQSGEVKRVKHNLNDPAKEDTGMICGGTMEFFIEPIQTAPHIYIFGGGHCGHPLAQLAGKAGFQYTLIEDRPEFAGHERFPDASDIMIGELEQLAESLDLTDHDYVAIVTRNHELDFKTLKNILKKPAKYIGLIGSKSKRTQIFSRLKKEGFSAAELERIHTPIGLNINAETPEEIAISILAEMISVKNG